MYFQLSQVHKSQATFCVTMTPRSKVKKRVFAMVYHRLQSRRNFSNSVFFSQNILTHSSRVRTCLWGFGLSKTLVALAAVRSVDAPVVCGYSVFGPCLVMQYLVPFLILQSS